MGAVCVAALLHPVFDRRSIQRRAECDRDRSDARVVPGVRRPLRGRTLGAGTADPLDCCGDRPLCDCLQRAKPAGPSFFIYGSALLGRALPVKQAIWSLVAQVVLAAVVWQALSLSIWFVIPATIISALIGAVCIQAAVNAARDAKLRLAQAEVEQLAKVAERERIARDLHDLLGHTLSVVVLKSELAQKLLSRDPDRARQEIAEVERIARDGLAEVREAITGYRTSGLQAEIQHVHQALVSAGIETTIDAPSVDLAPAQETALSLALREATTNVIRHAGATRCHIRFYARDGSLLMEVEDNGRGGDAPFGHGLTGCASGFRRSGARSVERPSGGPDC